MNGCFPGPQVQGKGQGTSATESSSSCKAEGRTPLENGVGVQPGWQRGCCEFRPSFINRVRSSPARSIRCGIGPAILECAFLSCPGWSRSHGCSCSFSGKVKKVQSELFFFLPFL